MFVEAVGNDKEKLQEIIDISDKIEVSKDDETYIVKATKGDTLIKFAITADENNKLKRVHYKIPFTFNKHTNLANIIEDLYLPNDKDLQDKLQVIYGVNRICPICNSQLEKNYRLECENNCYSFLSINSLKLYFNIKIFDTKYRVDQTSSLDDKINTINEIYNQLNYWKEDDRYLTEFIKRN
ncbi:gp469 [Bacillus phage G]|uniref:Gp469 n=1 Tax=Bacillus phage G TaxID=2884420 RepID=G3MAL0_9CAUD|nr:gp469 [Bacillus phage G]AEO93727.1 gp469 [Bacillus phage G]